MFDMHNMKLHQKQLQNQYDLIKGRYTAWSYLVNKTGNIYDPSSNTFNLTNQEWDDFSKGHPKLKTLKNATLLFPELCATLYDGTSASGAQAKAASSVTMRFRASSSSFNLHNPTLDLDGDKEDDDVHVPSQDIPTHGNQNPFNVEGTSETPTRSVSRPKKKTKKDDNLDALLKVCTNALTGVVKKQQKSQMSDACVGKLNKLGIDELDPQYCAVFLIFAHSPSYQEFWLKLPWNPVLLQNWLRTTARNLRFLME